MAQIYLENGELGIENDCEITIIPESTNLSFKVSDDKKTVTMTVRVNFEHNEKIFIGKGEAVEATKLGVFNLTANNCFNDGFFKSLILTTGTGEGEVRIKSENEDFNLRTDADKREHGQFREGIK